MISKDLLVGAGGAGGGGGMKPKRIQRRRTKGWRMPPNAVYVGKPTRWGNPFTVRRWGRRRAVSLYRQLLIKGLRRTTLRRLGFTNGDIVVLLWQRTWIRAHLEELRGKDLACWCPPELACHADVLLTEANR